MPPYVYTSHDRVKTGYHYDVRRPSDGASLGCGYVSRFEPEQMQHVFGKDEYIMPTDLKAVVDFPGPAGYGSVRLELPMDWIGERLPVRSRTTDQNKEDGVSTPTWAELFSTVVTRAGAGMGLTVTEGNGLDQDVVRLVWSSGDEATIRIESDYDDRAVTATLTKIDAATVRRRVVIQEELARQTEEYARLAQEKRAANEEAYRRKVEERVRAKWPRFELFRRSDHYPASHRRKPHDAAVWDEKENRWEVTAGSLDVLIMDVLGDVPYALHIVPRGKTAPADVLTVVEIVDVDNKE